MPKLALSADETWEFIVPEDRGEDNKAKPGCPVFTLGHLPRALRKHIENTTTGYQMNTKGQNEKADVFIKTGDRHELCAQYGTRGVSIDGKQAGWFTMSYHAAYKCEKVSDESLDVLRYYIDALGGEVWSRGEITEQEQKNSPTPVP